MKADREVKRFIQQQRRTERRQMLDSRESIATPYNLRTTMGRRGVNSSRGTGRDLKGEKTYDISTVAPIVLFLVSEKNNAVEKGAVRCCLCALLKILIDLQSHWSVISWKLLSRIHKQLRHIKSICNLTM